MITDNLGAFKAANNSTLIVLDNTSSPSILSLAVQIIIVDKKWKLVWLESKVKKIAFSRDYRKVCVESFLQLEPKRSTIGK